MVPLLSHLGRKTAVNHMFALSGSVPMIFRTGKKRVVFGFFRKWSAPSLTKWWLSPSSSVRTISGSHLGMIAIRTTQDQALGSISTLGQSRTCRGGGSVLSS